MKNELTIAEERLKKLDPELFKLFKSSLKSNDSLFKKLAKM